MNIKTILNKGENIKVEFKEHMNDKAYETIAAFANTKGGLLISGVSDDGKIIGENCSEKNVRNITNRIADSIKINPHIEVNEIENKKILLIEVAKSSLPISYRGKYYKRVGNTTREMSESELITFFQKWSNWDSLTNNCSLEEIDENTLNKFINRGLNNGRLNQISVKDSLLSKLEHLGLRQENKLTNAAVILFAKNPQKYFPNAVVRIGRFEDEITIIGDKLIEGNLFNQIEEADKEIINMINVRYEINDDSFQRKDIFEYPLTALRESIVNAIAHRDYFKHNVATQIKIFNDFIYIFNIGGLPEGITIDQIKKLHTSVPRNQLITRILYRAGIIEELGTGIERIMDSLNEANMLEPEFKEEFGGFSIHIYQKFSDFNLKNKGFNERQVKAIQYVHENKVITMDNYSKIAPEVDKRTLRRDLDGLVQKHIFLSVGKTKGRKYKLNYNSDILV
jgi:ATP-dependent DNA helicase RecG